MYETPPIESRTGGPVVGLALGSGAARGWAHLGVLKALEAEGVRPDVVCGSSIGALIGAAYASGRSTALEDWVCGLDWQDIVRMLDISFRGGLIRGERVLQYCAKHFFRDEFSQLELPFACVATELTTGREVWLRDGSLAGAVRASIALPGLFSPFERAGRVLVDGGLVNPVPVSLCRALGADIVIAVDLGVGALGRRRVVTEEVPEEGGFARRLLHSVGLHGDDAEEAALAKPSMTDVITAAINIMQTRIARSRLAGEPADVLISPRVAQFDMMDFHRASEAIEEGVAATARSRPSLMNILGQE